MFAPLPCPPPDASLPVYQIADGQFVIDGTANDIGMDASALTAQANAVSNLIVQTQSAATPHRMGMYAMDDFSPPGFGGSGSDYTNFDSFVYSFDTNQLWLNITNVSDGIVYANLNNATDSVYAILSTTDLLGSWQVEAEVWPTNGTLMPFVVNTFGRDNLFLRAEDWNGVTYIANEIPDWWDWYYFGNYTQRDDLLDANGNTYLYDYTNGYDPTNIIQFYMGAANNYVNYTNVSLQLTITAGTPGYYAIVGAQNPTTNWLTYTTTNLALSLGPADGVYNISVGLKSIPTNGQPAWGAYTFTLERVPPAISLISPAEGTVTQPVIQLKASANALLNGVTCILSNANGTFPNETALMTGQFFDTNSMQYTTNYIQSYDLQLTNGLNIVTLQATDLAGNTTTTNFSFTLDYSGDTNPPSVNILWPPNGTYISGNSFTFEGQLDDPTASVSLQIVDASGNTNTAANSTGRDGAIWADNLPLGSGANTLTITATDAAGNVSVTNLTVYQSTVTVTMDPLSSDELNQGSLNVSGTVSDPTVQVYVNGNQASVDSDTGNWTLSGLGVNVSGMLIFNIAIYSGEDDSGGGGGGSGGNVVSPADLPDGADALGLQLFALTQGPVVQTVNYNRNFSSAGLAFVDEARQAYNVVNFAESWTEGLGGTYDDDQTTLYYVFGTPEYPPVVTDVDSTLAPELSFPMENGPIHGGTVSSEAALKSGGPAAPGVMNTYLVSVQVNDANGNGLPASQIKVPGYAVYPETNNPTWGDFVVSAPNQATVGVTPKTPGYNGYTAYQYQVTNFMTIVDANSGTDLTLQTNTAIVGQQVNLVCQINSTNFVVTNFQWTVPGIAISNYVVAEDHTSAFVATNFTTNSAATSFYWIDGATNRIIQCSAFIDGRLVIEQAVFNVIRPAIDFNGTIGKVALDTNYPYYDPEILALHFGGDISGGVTNQGITCTDSNITLNGYDTNNSFGFMVVQIITNKIQHIIFSDGSHQIINSNGLDSYYPEENLGDSENQTFYDSPAAGGFTTNEIQYSVTESFSTVLMFVGDGSNIIPVPIKKVDWTWSGSIFFTNGNWTLVSTNSAMTANNANTFTFPTWSSVMKGLY